MRRFIVLIIVMAALGLRAPAQTGPAVTAILQSINRDSVTRLNFDLYLDGGLVIPQNEDIRYEVTRTSDSTYSVEFKLVWLRTPWDVDQSQMLFSRQVVLVDTGTFGVETHIFLDTFMDETIYYAPRHYHPVYYPSGVIERMASGDSLPRPQFKVTNSMGEWTYPLYDNALYGGVMGDNATIAAYIYHIYPEGTQVTIGPLGTMPDNFIGWSDCDDTMQVRTITLTQDTHIVALFDEVPPVCGRPRDLWASVSSEQVVFMWNDMGGDSWELAVAPDGGTPETANVMPCSNTMFTVQGLDTGRWHVAWVRSVCGTDSVIYSDWSDSVRFYVPGDGQQGTEGIGNTTDRYTYIMPNPASERVTVASSFRIGQVELYTLNGQCVLQQRVDGMSTVLDVSGLAAGTYILRVHTNNGVSNKKLVVKGA